MSFPYVHELETRTLLSEYQGKKDARTLKSWCDEGGYQRVRKAIEMSPETITDVVKESGLRGRGGAGFPTGLKWSFMPKEDGKPHYLCCNAD